MARDASHHPSRRIVHDAAQHFALGHFRRRNLRGFFRGRQEARVGHLERPEDFLAHIAVQLPSAGQVDQFAKDDEIDVAVDKGAAGHAAEFLRARHAYGGVDPGPGWLVIQIGPQA